MSLSKSYLEKYRPQKKEEIVGNHIIIERIFGQIANGKLVNMILTGESGIGKTTTAEIITRDILKENHSIDCKVINCSDKTGVDFVRKNIIDIARLRPRGEVRIFVLEESEELSRQAQNALRKPMEAPFDKRNRFIFLNNDHTKIIPAIKDRCRIYLYTPIIPEEMVQRLEYIAKKENIDISKELIIKLAESSNGSMRYPIIRLEEFKSLNRKIEEKDIILEESLETIKEIFVLLKDKKIPTARNKVMKLYQKGSNFNDIVRYFHDFIVISMKNESNYQAKAKSLIKVAESEFHVKSGCNEFISLSFLLSNISLLLNDKR